MLCANCTEFSHFVQVFNFFLSLLLFILIFFCCFWNFQCGTAWFVNEIETCAIFFLLPFASFRFVPFVLHTTCQSHHHPPPLIVLCCVCYAITSAWNCEKVEQEKNYAQHRVQCMQMYIVVHMKREREQAQNTQINIKSASECVCAVCVFRIVKISRMIKLKWGQQQIHAKQHTHIVRWDFRSFVYVFFLVLFLVSLHSASLAPIELILLKWLFRTIRKKSLIYFYCNWYTQEICVYARRYGAVCIVIERETRSERERESARAGTVIVFMLLIHTNTHYTI